MILDTRSNHRPPTASALNLKAGRPRELQDALNFHVFHPLARRLALLLARTPVRPNMVSVAGGMIVVAAGLAYAQPGWALAGLALHLAWHVIDGADGDLARLTNRASPQGELVDGICDYASHVILYLILGWLLQDDIGPIAWLPVVGAGMSRIVQANHYEVQRRQYQWWRYGTPWLRSAQGEGVGTAAGMRFGAAYLLLAQKIAPHAATADKAVAEASGNPQQLVRTQEIVGRISKPMLAALAPLGANYRTIALGLSILAGSPLYFFLYEATVLNLALLRSIRIANRSTSLLIAELHHAAASARR